MHKLYATLNVSVVVSAFRTEDGRRLQVSQPGYERVWRRAAFAEPPAV